MVRCSRTGIRLSHDSDSLSCIFVSFPKHLQENCIEISRENATLAGVESWNSTARVPIRWLLTSLLAMQRLSTIESTVTLSCRSPDDVVLSVNGVDTCRTADISRSGTSLHEQFRSANIRRKSARTRSISRVSIWLHSRTSRLCVITDIWQSSASAVNQP
jgi:hypothetical protein